MLRILFSVALIQVLLILFAILKTYLSKKCKKSVLKVYKQPNRYYYLKYVIIYSLLAIRKLKYLLYGKEKYFQVDNLEKLQPLSNHPKAFDAVFFQGISQDGFYFCGGTERRHLAKINGLFYVLAPKYGLLLSEELPNTLLEADPVSVLLCNEYSTGKIKFTPIEPMKKWKVCYNGKMKALNDSKAVFDVKFNAIWTSDIDWFLFEVDAPVSCIARAIAREKWSKKMFDALKSAHQTHYEQMGSLNGTLSINEEQFDVNMQAFRDHSFGFKRDWSIMHRYIFHMLYLENDARICLGVISQPCTTSHLEIGYMVQPNKEIHPITNCNLQLYQHGEDGVPHKDEISFIFNTNQDEYEVKVVYKTQAVHYVGNNCEAKMCERFVECEVNGIKGRGISEWHYNNTNEKNKL